MRAQRAKGRRHGVGRMGVVDEDRRAAVARRGQLHPAADAGQFRQGGKGRRGILAGPDHQTGSQQRVGRLEPADQVQSHRMAAPLPPEQHLLPRGVEPLSGQAQARGFGPADADDLLPARLAGCGQIGPVAGRRG